ncbi:hypothetical protein STH12_02560 [Shewanella khirikhana]|uniref:Cardiolipin synthase N-terminal domain-containing protein n=1 Tax=Shewanella khirikhana TaxID=1965282 RepID=A0ABM7DPM8_9GAMM|nr:hypothetical protein STH12_02560 [Shewanella khirikhana]
MFSTTLIGQIMAFGVFSLFVWGIYSWSYSLGKRKTSTPRKTAVIATCLLALPPVLFLYLLLLSLKPDYENQTADAGEQA